MSIGTDYCRVLLAYPADCQPWCVEPLRAGRGFSGAQLWRLQSPRGPLCLRRWPAEQTRSRLEFIQAVLWHVDQEGFSLVPVPLEARSRSGYVVEADSLWELTPWLPGEATFWQQPTLARLQGAMTALARFHIAAASFPLEQTEGASPGLAERAAQIQNMLDGGLAELEQALDPIVWLELAERGRRLIAMCGLSLKPVQAQVRACLRRVVPIQPCIRDIWHDHVLFQGDAVSGIVDFGAMRPETVAGDIARLVGSLVGDRALEWSQALEAYEKVRPLSGDEAGLIAAFDQSGVVLSGLSWLRWVFLEGRNFPHRDAVIERVDRILERLDHLVSRM